MATSINRRQTIAWSLALLGLALLLAAQLILEHPFFTGTDTGTWGADWERLYKCIQAGSASCGHTSKFPIAYLLNSAAASAMRTLGIAPDQTILAINIWFLAMPIIYVWAVRGTHVVRHFALAYLAGVFFSSIPPYYVYSGALEVQAGVVMGLAISTIVLVVEEKGDLKRPVLAAFAFPLFFLMPLYKDTNLVQLLLVLLLFGALLRVLFGSSALKGAWRGLQSPAAMLSIAGASTATALMILYNVFRYRSVLPVAYLAEAAATSPSAPKSVEFFAASLLSPNGGAIVFWSFSFFSAILVLKLSGYSVRRSAILLSSLLALSYMGGLSLWWAPFGWDSWGNRLLIPGMMAALISITVTACRVTDGARTPSGSTPHGVSHLRHQVGERGYNIVRAVTVPLVLFSLYYVIMAYAPGKEHRYRESLFGKPECSVMLDGLRSELGHSLGLAFWKTDYYYDCARARFTHLPRLGEHAVP